MERLTVQDLFAAHGEQAPQSPSFRRATEVQASSSVVTAAAVQPPTDAQVKFLRALVAERAPGTDPAHTEKVIAAGRKRVGEAITRLKAMPKVERPRVNQYPGTCEECGTGVHAGEGVLTKTDDGGWEVAHRPGECPVSEFPFPLGSYAVDNAYGEVRFYQATSEGLFVLASDALHPVHGPAQKAVIDAIAADPEAASRRYGLEWQVCGRCGRGLTDTSPGGSREQGLGPICATKPWT